MDKRFWRGILFIGVLLLQSLCLAAPDGIVRGIYCRPGLAMDSRLWRGYGQGYSLDAAVRHSGQVSIRCSNEDDTQARGAMQTVELNQDRVRPVVVGGWARLEGVEGTPNYRCSVYVDMRLRSGKSWPMKVAAFDPAVKGWQYVENVYTPPEPVASARVYAFLREKSGMAWFDDLYFGEVVDDAGTRSPNRLDQAGFERVDTDGNPHRNEFFSALRKMNCNAFHFYDYVSWDDIHGGDPLPALAPDDPMPKFVDAAQKQGFGVWMTVGMGLPRIDSLQDADHPLYACVNNRWGEAYTKAVAYFTQAGVDGIGVVPDEWTFTTGRMKRSYTKHSDPGVAEFYRSLPGYAHCPVCERRFEERYGGAAPDLSKAWASPDPAWGDFLRFRYEESARWMANTVKAAKAVNPEVITDTMICVLPVCSDNRIGAGAAWDLIGAETGLDCLQTDPYMLLHNYLGDSTHYYPTETTIHLTAANWKGTSGVTLEASRLRDNNRPKDPVEVYGTALSCLAHGAREFFWWHMNHVTGRTAFVDAEPARRRIAAAYEVMQRIEPFVLDARPSGDILVLYSRRSEDVQHWLTKAALESGTEPPQEAQALGDNTVRSDEDLSSELQRNVRRGFVSHKTVLNWLLRRGYPFRTTFLEHPDPAALAQARTVLVPYPFALTEREGRLIETLAREGRTVILMSCLGSRDERGQRLSPPRLAGLFGGASPDLNSDQPVERALGQGSVTFLGDDFARCLLEPIEPQKDRSKRVPLAPFDAARTATLESLIGRQYSAFDRQPETDIEAVVMAGSQGRALLVINWERQQAEAVALKPAVLGVGNVGQGWSIDADAKVRPFSWNPAEGPLSIAPQQAVFLRAVR